MNVLLEDGVWVELLEFGLEILQPGGVGGAVGATTGVGDVEAFVLDFFAVEAPGRCVSWVSGIGWGREGKGSEG